MSFMKLKKLLDYGSIKAPRHSLYRYFIYIIKEWYIQHWDTQHIDPQYLVLLWYAECCYAIYNGKLFTVEFSDTLLCIFTLSFMKLKKPLDYATIVP